MKRFVIPAAVLLTALILTGGFFLPTIILQYKDRQMIGELTVTDGSGVSYETKSELKTIERMKMVSKAEMVSLDNGKNMNADTAYQTALTELDKLTDKGILELDRAACRLSKYDVYFFIDSADPTKNMIVWFLLIEDENHMINTAVDDETGMLLALNYNLSKQAYQNGISVLPLPAIKEYAIEPSPGQAAGGSTVAELIGQTLADYYGLTFVGSEQQESEYYTRFAFELSDGQESIVLPVTFTYTGFYISS